MAKKLYTFPRSQGGLASKLFRESGEAELLADPTTLGELAASKEYLLNRICRAFEAGRTAGEAGITHNQNIFQTVRTPGREDRFYLRPQKT